MMMYTIKILFDRCVYNTITIMMKHVKKPPQSIVFCPICELKNSGVLRIVRAGHKNLEHPFTILGTLKKSGFIPCDNTCRPISTPNKWRDALHVHIQGCLGEPYDTYERGWQTKLRDQQLQDDLRRRIEGFTATDDDDLRLKMAVLEAVKDDPLALAVTDNLSKQELTAIYRDLVPKILAQQLQIISQAQSEYLSGERVTIPLKEFNSLEKCVSVFKTILGEYGVEKVIE